METQNDVTKRILVADDDEDILALASHWLEGAHHEVLRARDGEEALRIAIEEKPDIAILDVRMPHLTGSEVLRRLRADERTANMPVILFSAFVGADAIQSGIDSGAADYVTKPVAGPAFIERVESVLDSSPQAA